MLHLALVLAAVATTPAPQTDPERPPGLKIERLVRRLDWRDGLPTSYVAGLAQDKDGFIWVSGPAGISRYDGQSFTTVYRVGGGLLDGSTRAGRIVFMDAAGGFFEAKGTSVVRLADPEGGQDASIHGTVAVDGTVWRQNEGRITYRPPDGAWTPYPSPAPADDPVHLLFPTAGTDVFARNSTTLWRIGAGRAPAVVARIRGIGHVLERADGSLVIGANQIPGPVTTRVFEVRAGQVRLIFERGLTRFLGLAERSGRLWIGTDRGLFGLASGLAPLTISGDDLGAGAAVIDREGSMWIPTFRGLFQYPEPETYAAWLTGGRVSRSIVRIGNRSWLSTWGDLARFEDHPGGLDATSYGSFFGILCRDGAGSVWAQTGKGLVTVGDRGFNGGVPVGPHTLFSCSLGPGGDLWMSLVPGRIARIQRGGVPEFFDVPSGSGGSPLDQVCEDATGTVWASGGSRVCRAPADRLAGGAAAWACEDTSLPYSIGTIAAMRSGDIWIATEAGISKRTPDGWKLLGASRRLRSRWIHAIQPAAEGVWLVATGTLTRVVERPGTDEGFEIVEDLGAWHGLPTLAADSVAEDPDGTLWFASDAGLMKVPGEVRRLRPQPPSVALIEASADGHSLSLDRAVELPYRRNRLELRFAALSFRNPPAIRYRHRLRDGEAWSDATTDPRFRFVDLAPGRYRIEVAASLDGERWSAAPAAFAFRVLRPWYLQAWFFLAAAAALAAALAVAYRLRVRALLRLERQRTRIAMDLHDEVGAGLGTISVLAGIVASDSLGAGKRQEFAGRIAAVSRELSAALGDIVGSLRPGAGTLDAAWHQIVDRARPLYASETTQLEVQAPESIPSQPLALVARRSLFLLAMEALHNALKHARARRVVLGLAPVGPAWELSVEDDGVGIPAERAGPGRRGLGLDAMRARAAEMDAALRIEPVPSGGTRVVLRFRTGAER